MGRAALKGYGLGGARRRQLFVFRDEKPDLEGVLKLPGQGIVWLHRAVLEMAEHGRLFIYLVAKLLLGNSQELPRILYHGAVVFP